MGKAKIQERFTNAVDAFFETDANANANTMVYADSTAILRNEKQVTFTEIAKIWTSIARQAFLFLPGAFLLHFATINSVFLLPELGLTPLMLFHLLVGGFLCQVGLGSLRKTKNLLIPFSIAVCAAVLGIASFALPTEWQVAFCFEYSIYFFPLALIGSKLLQNRIEDK